MAEAIEARWIPRLAPSRMTPKSDFGVMRKINHYEVLERRTLHRSNFLFEHRIFPKPLRTFGSDALALSDKVRGAAILRPSPA
ncbi:hypothetical protein X759_09540 [Mesorhizobium sp. LSHC420B00]|nr:hypothetical protein X759_09540 [Mesorhizobium sp. LSHC420B00]